MPERDIDERLEYDLQEFEYNYYEHNGMTASPEVVSEFIQHRDEIKEAVESGNVNNIMEVFEDIMTSDIFYSEFQAGAVAAVAENGTTDDLRGMLEPYSESVGEICDMVKEAVENDKFSGHFDIFHLNDVLETVSDSRFLTDEEKDALSRIIITEEVNNPEFYAVCEDHEYLTRSGDFASTLDALFDISEKLQNENFPSEFNEKIVDFFAELRNEYIVENNDVIFNEIEDVVANNPDKIEYLEYCNDEGIPRLRSEIAISFPGAYPTEEGCDARLLYIRDIITDFIGGEETREGAIEKITAYIDEYREENDQTGIEESSADGYEVNTEYKISDESFSDNGGDNSTDTDDLLAAFEEDDFVEEAFKAVDLTENEDAETVEAGENAENLETGADTPDSPDIDEGDNVERFDPDNDDGYDPNNTDRVDNDDPDPVD